MLRWLLDAKKRDNSDIMPRAHGDQGCIPDPIPKPIRDVINEHLKRDAENRIPKQRN